ncbi:MAG TPA: hypothetical protein EYG85_10605 [Crocinitomix sp.]|nr:hypothetical protein [Crocinitomix sp.]
MKHKHFYQIGGTLLTALIFVGCSNSNDIEVSVKDNDTTSITQNVDNIETNELNVEYSVPTPNELFEIVKLHGGELNIDLVNSLDNQENYIDAKSKALNFGVYSADIGYMSCFDHGIEFLKYTKAIEKLGNDLGISDVFDKDLMDKIENNEGNSDTLFLISNQTYYDSYQYLEENEKGTELSLIIAGGYIESLYIVTHLVDNYSDDNPIIEKIGDQKLVLENIIDFCMAYMDDASVNDFMNDLMELSKVFEDNMTVVEEDSKVKDEDGISILSGGGYFKMNKVAFEAIKNKITELRNKITQN